MAWRPSRYLIEGVLGNTQLGKVTGWMRFAGMKQEVKFDLDGDFHRDVRGAAVRLRGDGASADEKEARQSMRGFAPIQTGKVGDMTAGLAPFDYGRQPYWEWYSHENGRVVIELDPVQVEIIGRPIPACESDPISREEQAQNMAGFLGRLTAQLGVPAIAVGSRATLVSDPAFTHWVIEAGGIVGEAHSVERTDNGTSFAFVRLFGMLENAEYGYVESNQLRAKENGRHP